MEYFWWLLDICQHWVHILPTLPHQILTASCHGPILLMRELKHRKIKGQGHIASYSATGFRHKHRSDIQSSYSVLGSKPSDWWGLLNQWMTLCRQAQNICMRAHWKQTCGLWAEEMNIVTQASLGSGPHPKISSDGTSVLQALISYQRSLCPL